MQFKAMDETLVEINKIKNITSIQFYYIKNVIPSLIVSYDNGKVLNLCSKDKYFIELVRKVRDVYSVEKDNQVLETITGKHGIDIDDTTKKIIENASLEKVNELYSFYAEKCSYDESLLFQIDEFEMLFPIVEYHLKDFFSKTNMNISINNDYTGYRNNYIVTGKIDGVNKTFKILFNNTRDNEYEFTICGLFPKCSSLNMKVKFEKEKIEVELNIPDYDIYSVSSYISFDAGIKSITEVIKNNIPMFYQNNDLEEYTSDEKIANHKSDDLKWYILPWNALYATNTKSSSITPSSKIVEKHNVYMQSDNESFIEKENYSKTFVREIQDGIVPEEVVLDEEIKNITCLPLSDEVYVIETRFLSSRGTDGYYEEKLNNKYFYHIARSETGIKGIVRDESININKDDINSKGDLLSKPRVLSLLKGDK